MFLQDLYTYNKGHALGYWNNYFWSALNNLDPDENNISIYKEYQTLWFQQSRALQKNALSIAYKELWWTQS